MGTRARIGCVVLIATLLAGQLSSEHKAASAATPVFKNLDSFAEWVQANHKAPFDRDSVRLPEGAAATLLSQHKQVAAAAIASSAAVAATPNVKINRDRDPWPKAEVAVGVDPVNGNVVVMTNDFRENWDHEFYHVSTNGGAAWSDDSMVGGADPYTFAQLTFESDPGVAFDSHGHSFLSAITGNSIGDYYDSNDNYANFDTQIIVAQGFNHGTYSNLAPIVIDTQPCRYFPVVANCPATLDKPLITVDNVAGSPHNGSIYVYYTVFCNDVPCPYGSGSVPAFGSAIVESHATGAGAPFSAPQIVSGSLSNEQFSYMVVDSHGVPHAFFDDFSSPTGSVNMYMSTLTSTGWVVHSKPVATFIPAYTATSNWYFRLSGTFAPGCGIHGDAAYCAFSANQAGTGAFESGLSVYLAKVNTQTGASTLSRVNNDQFNDSADHIFPWATTKADGSVYVGFYDDRNDPFLTKVSYWVAKSTDGGKTFPTQSAVSSTSFNPCVGFPGCGFFGDYTQIAAGPDGVVHAAWSDTRDGASMQVYGASITW
ncbi:MAG TPA: hypothetical protein VKV39_19630 [Candidatus Sulfotelmatobacter sp.]|nr:hypothetical protein [Candidatus Sulfotelmatobacter sp.]